MKSRRTLAFKKLFNELPAHIQELATKNYEIWKDNPQHPSIRFKFLGGEKNLCSARIGLNYRVLGNFVEPDIILWFWIGSHEDCNNLI